MQQLWLNSIGWDEILPSNLQTQWTSYSETLNYLNSIRIHRQIICNCPRVLEIHAFSDSSQKAYGTCVYLRSIDAKNNINVQLVCSKTKVAPLKTMTIPKLELCAALMMVILVKKIRCILDMPITDILYRTDSKIVISWVGTKPHLLDNFVSNRVSQIQSLCDHTDNIVFRYIPTKENPADFLSRGVTP
ncbi:hypothetical protein NQ317_000781 [Molorchus minor]|uniref:RNase H type-1 domain-containing protein n=1 Tax=Molorchus minor TaxID=1323400 RepID=A0ABQ9J1T8_9CUCU|nr:hypothetical protein NQ317_000781 [Molorchus minor]